MNQQMTLEDYKKKVETNLLKVSGSNKLTQQIMKDYANDFPQFYKENWSVEALTPALLNYFI